MRWFRGIAAFLVAAAVALGAPAIAAQKGPGFGGGATPVITGVGYVGNQLCVPAYTGASYQWTRDGVNIGGATSRCYTTVTADGGHTDTVAITLAGTTVTAALTISGSPVTTATVGSPYGGFTATASGGFTPYAYTLNAGTFPSGISLNGSTGAVSGTPTVTGTYSGLVIRATDAQLHIADLPSFTLIVSNLPTPTLMEELGDSRLANNESRQATSTYDIEDTFGNGYPAMFRAAINNAVMRSAAGAYGVGSTTSFNAKTRMSSTSNAATGNTTAQNATGDSADANFNVNSSVGTPSTTASPLTDPSNIVMQMTGINDAGFTGGTGVSPCGLGPGAGCYSTDPKNSFAVIDAMLTSWQGASKVVFLADETPRGRGLASLESHTVSGATSITATNTSQFVDAPDFVYAGPPLIDENGAVWTRVANSGACAGAAKTYWVSSGGVYTWCTGITKPVTAYITYSYDSGGGTFNVSGSATYQGALHSWLKSNASSFTPSIGTYSGPGALYGRTNMFNVPVWDALFDVSNGQNAYAGALYDGTHPSMMGQVLAAAAFRSAWLSAYPSYTAAQFGAPTLNNWRACTANGAASPTWSNTSCGGSTPGVMTGSLLTNCAAHPPSIYGSGALIATGAGGTFTGANVTSGSYNCSTGAWTVTLNNTPSNSTVVELREDPANWLTNGLMEQLNGTDGAGIQTAGATGTVPNGWRNLAGGGLSTCLGGTPTCTMTQTTTTCLDPSGATVTCQKIVIEGVLPTAGDLRIFAGNTNIVGAPNKVVAGNIFRSAVTLGFAPGPTTGHLFNVVVPSVVATLTQSSTYTPGYPGASASTSTLRSVNAGGSTTTTLIDTAAVNAAIAKLPAAMTNNGTALVIPIVTPPIDTTGFTPANITTASLVIDPSFKAGPISLTLYLWGAAWGTVSAQ